MEKIKVLHIDKDFINLAKRKINSENITIKIYSSDKSKIGFINYSEDGFYFEGGFFQLYNYEDMPDYVYVLILNDTLKLSWEFNTYKDYLDYEDITLDDSLIAIEEWL